MLAGPSPTGWQAVTWHEAGSRPVVESFQNSSPHSGILQFFFLLPPLHVIFFPSHLQIKLTRAPGINGFLGLPPCSHPGPGPWFLTVICKPRRPRWKKLLYFFFFFGIIKPFLVQKNVLIYSWLIPPIFEYLIDYECVLGTRRRMINGNCCSCGVHNPAGEAETSVNNGYNE